MRNWTIGIGFFLVGCGGVTPMSGDYVVTSTLVSGDCVMLADEEAEEPLASGDSMESEMTLDFQDDGSVVIGDDENTECTLKGATVTCSTAGQVDFGPELDLVLVLSGSSEYVFDSNTSFSGTSSTSMSCEGADCSVLESSEDVVVPCSSEFDIAGSMAEDAASAE